MRRGGLASFRGWFIMNYFRNSGTKTGPTSKKQAIKKLAFSGTLLLVILPASLGIKTAQQQALRKVPRLYNILCSRLVLECSFRRTHSIPVPSSVYTCFCHGIPVSPLLVRRRYCSLVSPSERSKPSYYNTNTLVSDYEEPKVNLHSSRACPMLHNRILIPSLDFVP